MTTLATLTIDQLESLTTDQLASMTADAGGGGSGSLGLNTLTLDQLQTLTPDQLQSLEMDGSGGDIPYIAPVLEAIEALSAQVAAVAQVVANVFEQMVTIVAFDTRMDVTAEKLDGIAEQATALREGLGAVGETIETLQHSVDSLATQTTPETLVSGMMNTPADIGKNNTLRNAIRAVTAPWAVEGNTVKVKDASGNTVLSLAMRKDEDGNYIGAGL